MIFQILKRYGTEWIVNITDITDFVHQQKKILDKEGSQSENFLTASERVYIVKDFELSNRLELDVGVVESQPTIVSTGAAANS